MKIVEALFKKSNNIYKSLPSTYVNACLDKGKDYYDYKNYKIPININQDDYEAITMIGKGKFGLVYSGINILNNSPVVLKFLKPIDENKVKREIKILNSIRGIPNTLNLQCVLKDKC